MAKVSAKYLELIRNFPLRPIRSETGLGRAEKVLLLDAEALTDQEQDYLEILGNLIEDYEEKAYPVEDVVPHKMLAGLIEAKGVTQTEVSKASIPGIDNFGIARPETTVQSFPY